MVPIVEKSLAITTSTIALFSAESFIRDGSKETA
jgi:hypothetical protein